MQDNVLISVIVTIYNVKKYLERCLDSIISQTYKNLEIILIDDGSYDGSEMLCDNYLAKDERIRVLHKKNGGLVAARKSGVAMATGELVAYVDADDWIDADFYERLMEVYGRNHADVVMGACIKETEVKHIPLDNFLNEGYYDRQAMIEQVFPRMLYAGEFYKFGIQQYLWNKLYKRELLLEAQMKVDNNILNGEDVVCLYPLLLEANSIEITNIHGYHYWIHTDSTTAKLNEDYPYDVYPVYKFLDDVFKKSSYENMLKRQLVMYYTHMTIMSARYLMGMNFTVESQYRYNFPFEKVTMHSRVLLLMHGAMGREYLQQLQRTGMYHLVGSMEVSKKNYELSVIRKECEELKPDVIVVGSESILTDNNLLLELSNMLETCGCKCV